MGNIRRNNKGQFTIIAALLVAVILVGTLVTTYSAIQSTASRDQPQVLSSVDETNLALKQLLGFTVGYYGSILQVTGNTSYAQNLASSYLNSGLENIADAKPELGLSFKVTNLNLNVNWFMTSSYSSGSLNVTYDITSLGIYGLPYFLQCRLDVSVLPSITGGPAIVSVIQDGATPLNTLIRQNFKFYRYQSNLTTWDLISISSDPQAFSNGTYLISIPPGYGIDSAAYLMQITDSRGVNVIGSSFNGYSSSFIWSSPYSAIEQFVTQQSTVDSFADKGSHSSFGNQTAKDNVNDVLTEQNTGVNTEQFVTQQSTVDSFADKGSHSSFGNQTAKDNVNDVLTEQNTGGWSWRTPVNIISSCGQDSGQPATLAIDANTGTFWKHNTNENHQIVFDMGKTYNINQVELYEASSSANRWGAGGKVTVYVSDDPISLGSAVLTGWNPSTNSGWQTSPTFTAKNGRYVVLQEVACSSQNSHRMFEFKAQCAVNFELDLEEQFTNVDFSQSNEQLCVYAGSLGSESLKVDVYSGGSWVPLIPALVANTWNNVSVSTYLTSATFTIRFKGAVESGDSVQDTWQVDAVLVHTWTPNFELDLEEQFTNVDFSQSNEQLCVYAGSLGSESLKVDVYSGGSWVPLIPALVANTWNNVSVSTYLTSATFTIRFKGAVESGDSVQDTWQVDATMLSCGSTIDPSSIQDSVTTVEWLQNGTMRMFGQGLVTTTQASPIPPIPIKAIHLNQTFINGTNREIPFQIESWGSHYNIPLGITNNATVFGNSEMVVYLLNTNVSKVIMWWNGSDISTQTPYAFTQGSFNDNPVIGGTLSNGKIILQFPSSGFNVIATTIGGTSSTTNFMRINGETSNYGAGYAFVVHHGVVRDIVLQEPEWPNGAGINDDCPNIYSNIILTLPAGTSYFTYQLRLMFINSSNQARTISDLVPIQLTTTLTGAQAITENGTSTISPIVTSGTGTFKNYIGASFHRWSQFNNTGGAGTGILFTDLANQQLYFFDAKGSNPGLTGALNVSNSSPLTIELSPVTPLRTVLGYNTPAGDEVTWSGAVATFDSNMTPIYTVKNNSPTGLWLLVEYSPVITVKTIT